MRKYGLLLVSIFLSACTGIKTTKKTGSYSECQQTIRTSSEQILTYATDTSMNDIKRMNAIELRCQEFLGVIRNSNSCTKNPLEIAEDSAINVAQIEAVCEVNSQSLQQYKGTTDLTDYKTSKSAQNAKVDKTKGRFSVVFNDERLNNLAGRFEGKIKINAAPYFTREGIIATDRQDLLVHTSYLQMVCLPTFQSRSAQIKKGVRYEISKSIALPKTANANVAVIFLEVQVEKNSVMNMACMAPEVPTVTELNHHMKSYFHLELKTMSVKK